MAAHKVVAFQQGLAEPVYVKHKHFTHPHFQGRVTGQKIRPRYGFFVP
jgi:hypothetical protein